MFRLFGMRLAVGFQTRPKKLLLGAGALLLLLFTLTAAKQEDEVCHKVGSSLGLQRAFLDQKVTDICITGDIELRRDIWAGRDYSPRFMIPLKRNVTLRAHPSLGNRPKIDTDFMQFRAGPGENRSLTVKGLEFVNAARHPDTMFAVPFFGQQHESAIILIDIISTVVVDDVAFPLSSLSRLPELVKPEFEGFNQKKNNLTILEASKCRELSKKQCPLGGLFISEFVNHAWFEDRETGEVYLAWLAVRDMISVAVNVRSPKLLSTEDISKKRHVICENAFDLYSAIVDSEVVSAYLVADITFDMSAWPNPSGDMVKTVYLTKDLFIATHSMKRHTMILDFNLAEDGIDVADGVNLELNRIMLKRTSSDPNKTFELPFFLLGNGSTLILDNVVIQAPVSGTDVETIALLTNVLEESTTASGEGSVSVEFLGDKNCTAKVQGKSKFDCGFLVNSLLPKGEALIVSNNSFFAAWNVEENKLMKEEEILYRTEGVLVVSSEIELRDALADDTVNTIWLRNNINFTRNVWQSIPRQKAVRVERNLTINSHPQTVFHVSLNLGFMMGRVVVASHHIINFQMLNLTQVSMDPSTLHYVPFFWWEDQSEVNFTEVVSQMAVEPDGFGPLDKRYERSFTRILSPLDVNETEVEILEDVDCERNKGISCPNRAFYIVKGAQIVDLHTLQPGTNGTGTFWAQEMLTVAIDIEKTNLQLDQSEASTTSGDSSDGSFYSTSTIVIGSIVIGVFVVLALVIGFGLWTWKVNGPMLQPVKRMRGSKNGAVQDMRVALEHQEVAARLLGDVKLGPLKGMGSFGRVYSATWNGTPVAVKVILHRGDMEAHIEREAILCTKLRHPNLVQGYHYASRGVEVAVSLPVSPTYQKRISASRSRSGRVFDAGEKCKTDKSSSKSCDDDDLSAVKAWNASNNSISPRDSLSSESTGAGSFSPTATSNSTIEHSTPCSHSYQEFWLVQEYCDRGSLLEAVVSGLFTRKFATQGVIDMEHLLKTCQDVARGMKYLHDNNVIHGDLKSSNILLQRSASDPRGYIAKVADFGLSRQMVADKSHMSTSSFGTVTHMPPEVLMQGHLSLKADVYSFGMIMWEMITSQQPFHNMMQMEVMRKVVLERKRPEFPSWTPPAYKELAEQCWCHDAHKRVTFKEALDRLREMTPSASGSESPQSTSPRVQ